MQISWLHERTKTTKGRVNLLRSYSDEHNAETETRLGKYLSYLLRPGQVRRTERSRTAVE